MWREGGRDPLGKSGDSHLGTGREGSCLSMWEFRSSWNGEGRTPETLEWLARGTPASFALQRTGRSPAWLWRLRARCEGQRDPHYKTIFTAEDTHSNVFIHSLEKSSRVSNTRPRTARALLKPLLSSFHPELHHVDQTLLWLFLPAWLWSLGVTFFILDLF